MSSYSERLDGEFSTWLAHSQRDPSADDLLSSLVRCLYMASEIFGPLPHFSTHPTTPRRIRWDSGARQQIRYIFVSTSHLVPPLVIVSHCVRPSAEYYPPKLSVPSPVAA